MPLPRSDPSALSYSRAKLAGLAALTLGASVPVFLLALRFRGDEGFSDLQELYIFYLFGAYGPRIALMTIALAAAGFALLAVPKFLRRRTAIAIRPGGIELNGLLRSRFIPWAALEDVGLLHQEIKGKVHTYLAVSWRRLPGDRTSGGIRARQAHKLSLALLAASPEDVAVWLRALRRARPRPVFAPRPPAAGIWRRLLGRRPV